MGVVPMEQAQPEVKTTTAAASINQTVAVQITPQTPWDQIIKDVVATRHSSVAVLMEYI